MAAIDDLLVKVGAVGEALRQIEESRSRLNGYREARQNYALLIDAEIVKRDELVQASKTALQELADAINAALPKNPPPGG